jgi:hypothetical protein
MVAREFGLMDYVVGSIHLGMLLALLCGGIYLIYRGIKNQKI